MYYLTKGHCVGQGKNLPASSKNTWDCFNSCKNYINLRMCIVLQGLMLTSCLPQTENDTWWHLGSGQCQVFISVGLVSIQIKDGHWPLGPYSFPFSLIARTYPGRLELTVMCWKPCRAPEQFAISSALSRLSRWQRFTIAVAVHLKCNGLNVLSWF